jgi:NAD(P)-dependent dehydrogenase (short-subunit alcohol dehydrogenase family)
VLFRSDQVSADKTLAELEGNGHLAIKADVADPDQVEKAVNDVIQHFGSLDIVVNNAGIGNDHPLPTTNYEDWQQAWRQTIDANLIGPANICFCAAKHMIDQGGGRIVNITSRGAFRGEPNKAAYGASKAGLNSLSQSLAVALGEYKIFVGAVAPGFVNTELTADRLNGPEGEQIKAQSPFNRVAEPEEVAHAVLLLASEGAEFSTGTIIDVNGASYLRS